MKERQPMFHPLMFAPRAHRFVERIIRACRTKFQPIVLAKPGDRGVIQNDLGHRGKFDNIQLGRRQLRDRIKPAGPIQNITEHVQTHRPTFARRENVDDTAPQGIVARFGHRMGLNKAHAHQKVAQALFVNPVTHARAERRLLQDGPRRDPLGRRAKRRQQNKLIGHPVGQPGQSGHARRRNIGIGRHPVIGRAIPPRKHDDRKAGREKSKGIGHRRHAPVIAGHVDDRAPAFFDLTLDQRGVKSFRCSAQGNLAFECHLISPAPQSKGSASCPTLR